MTAPSARGRLLATADLAPAPSWSDTGRGLEADVEPLWVGVREYEDESDPSKRVREFRDPRQLDAEYLALWGRLPAAPGHPVLEGVDGKVRLVFLDADAPAEGAPHPADPDGAVLMPHARYQIGTVGDAYKLVPGEHGTQVPRFRLTVTDGPTRKRILNPAGGYRRDQVSPGFLRYVVDGAGSWTAPDGSVHPYDREQVVNPRDPRVPEDLRPHVGPNYLGVGFDPRRSWTRGKGAAKISLDGALATADLDGALRPRTFSMSRAADESGVSGTGHVLDGVVFPSGRVVTCWCAPSGPIDPAENLPQPYVSWSAFHAIHVGQHPGNGTEFEFDDGQPPPPVTAAPAAPTATPAATGDSMPPMTLEQALAEIVRLKQLLAERDAKDAEAMKAAADAKTAADAEAAKTAEAAKVAADGEVKRLRAERDALAAEVKPHRELARKAEVERVAGIAGVDGDALAAEQDEVEDPATKAKTKVPARDLRVAAMRMRLRAGVDGQPGDPRDAEDPAYLRARFDLLAQQEGQSDRAQPRADDPPPPVREPLGPSEGFRRAVAGADGSSSARKVPPRDATLNALP